MASITHVVQQGECLTSIAKAHKFADWHLIYDDPQNSELRKKRPNPNVLFPGDEVVIPEKQHKTESGVTGKLHKFRITSASAQLQIVLKLRSGKVLSDATYTLKIGDEVLTGKTGNDGLLKTKVPLGVTTGELILDDMGVRWQLQIGHLDPVEDGRQDAPIISGIQARLNNLGFRCGPVDGIFGPRTKAALARYQQAVLHRDNPSGEPDGETRKSLLKSHGS